MGWAAAGAAAAGGSGAGDAGAGVGAGLWAELAGAVAGALALALALARGRVSARLPREEVRAFGGGPAGAAGSEGRGEVPETTPLLPLAMEVSYHGGMGAQSEKDAGNHGGKHVSETAGEAGAEPVLAEVPFDPDHRALVPLEALRIVPGRNPRIHSEASVRALAQEILADGQLEAIMVCDDPDGEQSLQVVHGHRRLLALRLLERDSAVCDFKATMTPRQADRVCFALQRDRLTTWEQVCDVQRRLAADPKITVEALSSATGYPRMRATVMILTRVDPLLVEKLRTSDCFDKLVECCRIEPDQHELIRYEAQQVYWAKGAPKKQKPCKPGLAHILRAIKAIEASHKIGRVPVTPQVERAVLRMLRFLAGLTVGSSPKRGHRRLRMPKAA